MGQSYQEQTKNLLYNYIEEVDFLIHAQRYHLAFLVMAQIIETLGAFLDDKPLRAKEQSRSRFDLALKKLFPPSYHKKNERGFLYIHYRCNMTHLLMSSGHITLGTLQEHDASQHLQLYHNTTLLLAEPMFHDIKLAADKLLLKIDLGHIKEKKGIGG